MLRSITSGVSVLICASFLSVGKPESTPAPQLSGTRVAIPNIEPRSEDVSSIDGMVRAYFEVVSGPAEKKREWGRTRPYTFPEYGF